MVCTRWISFGSPPCLYLPGVVPWFSYTPAHMVLYLLDICAPGNKGFFVPPTAGGWPPIGWGLFPPAAGLTPGSFSPPCGAPPPGGRDPCGNLRGKKFPVETPETPISPGFVTRPPCGNSPAAWVPRGPTPWEWIQEYHTSPGSVNKKAPAW